MTDNDIIKALEWCELFTDNIVLSNQKGEKFTFALQSLQTIKQVLKDYNLQKAEIERLTEENEEVHSNWKKLKQSYDELDVEYMKYIETLQKHIAELEAKLKGEK